MSIPGHSHQKPPIAKHARTDRATYAPFGEVGWRGWTVVSIRGALWARSVRYGVMRHSVPKSLRAPTAKKKDNNMNDELAFRKIEKLTANEYVTAFTAIREQMTESDMQMLQAHYQSPDQIITATELANKVGFTNYGAANLRYGILASKLLEFFQIRLDEYVKINALVYLNNPNNEWEWTLRPQVVQALKKLKWFK